jgi:hypothetical protein
MPTAWRRIFLSTGIAVAFTIGWGLFTGHGVGGSGVSASVAPFNASWREAVAIILLGAGAFLAIPVAWVLARRDAPIEAGLYLGTVILVTAGVIAWGLRLGDFNMFHVFFGGIAVFAAPVAAIAVWSVARRARASGRSLLGLAVVLLCAAQIELGVGLGVIRLQGFGPGNYAPVPLELETAIRNLPAGAKVAYSCQPSEEVAIWEPRLLSIGAHVARRIVPMCFQSESLGLHTGTAISIDVPSPLFQYAPQRVLYPRSSSRPSAEAVLAFLKNNGIGYIYADPVHPNALVPGANLVAASGVFQLLQVP